MINNNNNLVWDGVIFLRGGLFKDGKFKFKIEFEQETLRSIPKIIFKSNVYHPLINIKTGELDMKVLLIEKNINNLHLFRQLL